MNRVCLVLVCCTPVCLAGWAGWRIGYAADGESYGPFDIFNGTLLMK